MSTYTPSNIMVKNSIKIYEHLITPPKFKHRKWKPGHQVF